MTRINEIHYDNAGADIGEFIEIRVDAGFDVAALEVELYNGSNGSEYGSASVLAGEMTTDGTYDYYVLDIADFTGPFGSVSGIQNGSPDGILLRNGSTVIEFLSYEGTFTGSEGFGYNTDTIDIGASEASSTPVGSSLQRSDDGLTWTRTDGFNTAGAANDTTPPPPEEVLISEIQGSGDSSTRVGDTVTVTAIVVGDFETGDGDSLRNLGGFFLQEENEDHDADAATSEGIFVFTGGLSGDVGLGDRVTVTGTVTEFFGMTQISADSFDIVEAGAVADVNDLAVSISLPTADAAIDDGGRYVPDLEAYEGMLVTFDQTLTVNELFQLDRFNEIKLVAGDRPYQFTQLNEPDADAYDAYLQDVGRMQIVYDDGLNVQNADIIADADLNGDGVFDTSDGFTMGDTVTGLTGVLDYSWAGSGASPGTWRIRSVEDDANTFFDANERPDGPPDTGGDLTLVSFNILNYFATLDLSGVSTALGFNPRGADNADEFARQTDKLVDAIIAMEADVLGLVELENDFTDGAGNAVDFLVDAVNATLGANIYDWVRPDAEFVGDDAIAVGMIYRTDTVTYELGSVEILDDSDLDALGFGALDDDGLGVFNGPNTNRSPLAATFTDLATGEDFTYAVTHMKSKGGSGTDGNADLGDGAGNYDEMRTEGVEVLTAWLDSFADDQRYVVGDFNAYAMEDPIDAMADAGYINLEDPFTTSFVFDGQIGTLDYGFANGAGFDAVIGAEIWAINSAEPDAIDYNFDFGRDPSIFDGSVPFRVSDHDPLLFGVAFDDVLPEFALVGDDGNDKLKGSDIDDVIYGLDGDDHLKGKKGDDLFVGGAGADKLQGNDGSDTASYATSSAGVTVDLKTGKGAGGDAEGDQLSNIENLIGSDFGDSLTGDNQSNRLAGGAGADLLCGGKGVDEFDYADGDGMDTIKDFDAAAGELLHLDVFGVYSVETALGFATETGAGTVFDFGDGDTLTLLDTQVADLTDANFDFGTVILLG